MRRSDGQNCKFDPSVVNINNEHMKMCFVTEIDIKRRHEKFLEINLYSLDCPRAVVQIYVGLSGIF